MHRGSGRRRALGVVLAGLGALVVAASSLDASAEGPVPPIESTTTSAAPPGEETTTTTEAATTTTAPRETTSTTEADRPSLPVGPSSTTTSTTTPPASGGGGSAEPPPPSTGDGGVAPTDAGPFPGELQALTNSIRRTRANNTKALLVALAPLQQYGLSEAQAAVVGFGRFPVAGLATYSHDWWFPRFGPGWRLHEGTDIFAPHGTPVRAPVDGNTKVTNGGLGGLSVYVVQPDGTYWYLAHLAAVAEGIENGTTVKTGQVVGFVGDSGNARGGPPHVHFEVHPGGGGPIDPKPVLDQFIADALAIAPQVVDAYARAHRTGTEPASVAAPATAAIAPALPMRAALLWTTAVSPTGGALQLAEAEAARVASRIEWKDREPSEGTSAFERHMARRYARWWVQPLVHPLLARHLTTAT